MNAIDAVREELRAAFEEHYARSLARPHGVERPDPGRLVREGLRAARDVLAAVPDAPTVSAFLDAAAARLEALAVVRRKHPVSDDGWEDEDGWILGGIATMRREVERRRR